MRGSAGNSLTLLWLHKGTQGMKAMGNERSYILMRFLRIWQYPGEVGLGGSPGATGRNDPAKTFLLGNSHVWSCDLIYPICPTCWPKSRDSANLPYMSWP